MPLGIAEYRPRHAEHAVLCPVIDEHLEAFFAAAAPSIQRIGASLSASRKSTSPRPRPTWTRVPNNIPPQPRKDAPELVGESRDGPSAVRGDPGSRRTAFCAASIDAAQLVVQ
jgi:hypothetical protein